MQQHAEQARMLRRMVWAAAIMAGLLALLQTLGAPHRAGYWAGVAAAFGGGAWLSLASIRRGRPQLAGSLYVITLWTAVTTLILTGSFRIPVGIIGFLVVVSASALVLEARGAAVTVGACLATTAAISWALRLGLLPAAAPAQSYTWWVSVLFLVGLSLDVQYLNVVALRQALRRAHEEVRSRDSTFQALLDSESRYRGLLDTSPLPTMLTNREANVTIYVNPRFVEMFGYRLEDIPTAEAFRQAAFPDPDYRAALMHQLAAARPGDDTMPPFEAFVVCRGGARRHTEVHVSWVGSEYKFVFVDLTARDLVLAELRGAEARQRALLEALPDRMYRVRADGTMIDFSASQPDELPLPPEAFLGRRIADIASPSVAAALTAALSAAIATRRLQVCEYTIDRQGDPRTVECRVVASGDDEAVAIMRDITDARRNEERLRDSESRYRHFVQLSAEGIWRRHIEPPIPLRLGLEEQVDLILERARVAECNDAYARHVGVAQASEVLGRPISPVWREQLLAFARSGYSSTTGEFSSLDSAGLPRRYETTTIGVVEKGCLVDLWGTTRDVTDREAARQRMIASENRYRLFVEMSAEGVFRRSPDPPVPIGLPVEEQVRRIVECGRLSECNDSYARLFDRPRPELLGRTIAESGLGTPEVVAALRKFAAGGYRLDSSPFSIAGPAGLLRHYDLSLTGIVSDGLLVDIWGTLRDLTGRRSAERLLAESESRYRRFLEISTEGVCRRHIDPPIPRNLPELEQAELIFERACVTECNDAYARQLGLARAEEVLGRTPSQSHMGAREDLVEVLLAFVRSGYNSQTGPFATPDPQGEIHYHELTLLGILENDALVDFWCVMRDVTDRTRSERLIAESESRYRRFVEMSEEGVYRYAIDPPVPVDLDPGIQAALICDRARIAECNDAFARQEGHGTAADMLGKPLLEGAGGTRRDHLRGVRAFVTRGYRLLDLENTVLRRDGTPGQYEASAVGLIEHGCLVNIWGTRRDITARKRAEEHYRRFVHMSAEGVWRRTIEPPVPVNLPEPQQAELIVERARLAECNDAFAALLGHSSAAEVLGYGFEERGVHSRQEYVELMLRMVRGGYRDTGARSVLTRRGQPVSFESTVVGIVENGLLTDLWGTTRDITALQQAHDDLERRVLERTSQLAEANEQLKQLDRLKSEFLASMSHELRTPLNSIIGFSGIMRQGLAGPLTGEQTKQLDMVHNSARHLLSLINDLLDLSRIEAGHVELTAEPFDFSGVVAEVLAALSPQASKKGLRVTSDLDEICEMQGDRRRCYQVLLNLAGNAVKFTEFGDVRIIVRREGGMLRVSVADDGIGIRPESLPLLFEAFRQVDGSSRKKYEGTGLGLHLCRKLVTLMGGTIRAESEFGKGSVFTFTIPAGAE